MRVLETLVGYGRPVLACMVWPSPRPPAGWAPPTCCGGGNSPKVVDRASVS